MKKYVIFLIIFLAFLVRIWHLGTMPPSLTWDEAALGYNAYSILKTGRDEYGRLLPLIFKSFGDYKPGLYIYLTVPFVWLLGLTELAVRLPSAILGGLSVWLVYLLVKEMRVSLGLLTALILALNPWHINFSRGAWEANVGLFFVLMGTYLFLRALKTKNIFLYLLSSISCLLSLYTYQGTKLFVPLLLLGLILIYKDEIQKLSKKQIVFALLPFILAIPLYFGVLGKAGGRLKVMSVFSYPRPMSDIQELLIQGNTQDSLIFRIFHGESLNFARAILGRYFNHFSGQFLFFEGDWQNPRLGVPYMGMLYFIDLVFVLLGLTALAKSKGKAKYLVLWWLLIAPIPAALSRDSVSSVRALPMVIPLVILVSLGIEGMICWMKGKSKILLVTCRLRRASLLAGYLLFVICYSWHLAYYFDQYYVHRAKKYSRTMQYGYKEVVDFVTQNFHENYKRIIVTQHYGQPHIYWLFYTQYNPKEYQQQSHLTESPVGDVGEIEKIDNIEFRDIYWPDDRSLEKTLVIGSEFELPLKDIEEKQARLLREIKFFDGFLAFRIVETL